MPPPANGQTEQNPVESASAVLTGSEIMSPRVVAVEDVWEVLAQDLLSNDNFNRLSRQTAQEPSAKSTVTATSRKPD